MQNIKTLADLLLVHLIDKESKKQNISKNEFDIMIRNSVFRCEKRQGT